MTALVEHRRLPSCGVLVQPNACLIRNARNPRGHFDLGRTTTASEACPISPVVGRSRKRTIGSTFLAGGSRAQSDARRRSRATVDPAWAQTTRHDDRTPRQRTNANEALDGLAAATLRPLVRLPALPPRPGLVRAAAGALAHPALPGRAGAVPFPATPESLRRRASTMRS